MTEKPAEKQNISEFIAQIIYEQYEESRKELDRDYPEEKRYVDELELRFKKAKLPLTRHLVALEWSLRAFELKERCSAVLTLNSLFLIAEASAMAAKDPKATQAQQDELKARVQKHLQEIDEHVAKRIAKIYDMKGHEAIYGAGSRPKGSAN